MTTFQIGDRVQYTQQIKDLVRLSGGDPIYSEGVVLEVIPPLVKVQWDGGIGRAMNPNGVLIGAQAIELVEAKA